MNSEQSTVNSENRCFKKRLKQFRAAFIVLLTLLTVDCSLLTVKAYEPEFADSTKKLHLRWRGAVINVSLSNSLKQSAPNIKSNSDVVSAVLSSLKTWEAAANVRFNTVWTDKVSISAADGKGDGASLITIAATPENAAPFQDSGSEMPGRTRTFYNRRGEIIEADIVLNPYQQFSTDGSFGTFDLEAALTHEIGHLLGLDHSDVLAATMYAQQGKNGTYSLPAFAPRTLAETDRAAVRALYGARIEDETCCGAVGGTISNSQGKPFANWRIWAEESATGRLFAAVSTTENGGFEIGGLPEGKYRVLAQAGNFAAEVLGEAVIENNKTTVLNRKIAARPIDFRFSVVGFNAQLSTLAVPLGAGRSNTIFFGAENLAKLSGEEITVVSPFFQIVQSSLNGQDFETTFPVYSIEMRVSPATSFGEYSLRVENARGEASYLIGCFSIEQE